jgi:hypothetical protein
LSDNTIKKKYAIEIYNFSNADEAKTMLKLIKKAVGINYALLEEKFEIKYSIRSYPKGD